MVSRLTALLVLAALAVLAGHAHAQDTVTLTLQNSPIQFTFTRTTTTSEIVVLFSVSGTAVLNTDYSATASQTFTLDDTSGSITLPIGVASATIDIMQLTTGVVKEDETLFFELQATTDYVSGTSGTVGLTLLNPDRAPVSVAIVGATTVTEGDTPNVRFTMMGNREVDIQVLVLVSGTATFALDFTVAGPVDSFNGTHLLLTFAASPTMSFADFTLTIVDDAFGELTETIEFMVVDQSTLYTAGTPSTATLSIVDGDPPSVAVSVSPASIAEATQGNFTFTFTRAGNDTMVNPMTVQFNFEGTATINTDYSVAPGSVVTNNTAGTLTFAVNIVEIQVIATVIDNMQFNADRTIIVNIADSANYIIAQDLATGTILNDDTEVFLTVSPLSIAEDSASSMTYNFTRLGSTAADLTVNFAVGGTASFGTDYSVTGQQTFTSTAGSVIIPATETTVLLAVSPLADTDVEGDETVALTLTANAAYTRGTTTAVIATITNDDLNTVTLSLNPTSVRENSGTPLVYTFTRAGDAAASLTVNFAVGGTAGLSGVGGTDFAQTGAQTFSGTAGTIIIAASTFSSNLFITPLGDSNFEQNETVTIQLTTGTGYIVGTATPLTGTIVNDDSGTSTVSLVNTGSTSTVFEASGQPIDMLFSRNGDTGRSLTVKFAVGGSARFGVDYVQSGANVFTDTEGDMVFLPGITQLTLSLTPVENNGVDDDRSILITLISDTTYIIDSTANTASGLILDDDIVTIDNLEPAVTTASSFQFMAIVLREEFEFVDNRQEVINSMRVAIANFLSISSIYVDVIDVYLQNAKVRLFSVPFGLPADELAETLRDAINADNEAFFATVLSGARAFLVSNTFGDPPTFAQDFGIDQTFIDGLIGDVPASEQSMLLTFESVVEMSSSGSFLLPSILSLLVLQLLLFMTMM